MNQTITYFEMNPLQTFLYLVGILAVIIVLLFVMYWIGKWLEEETGGEL
jgi:hypothetical protein